MKPVQVALLFPDQRLMGDNMFSAERELDTSGGTKRWVELRTHLEKLGCEIHTADWFSNLRDAESVIAVDPTRSLIFNLFRSRVNPRRIVFIANEPLVVRRWMWRYMPFYAPLMGQVFVSDRTRANGKKIKWLPLPQPFDGHELSDSERFRSIAKDKFMVMLRANKISNQPSELYGKRRDLVRYFESREDNLFDLHGPGWNDPNHAAPVMYRNYRGFASGTVETYARYKFTLGMDNSAVPGLFTYDLFSAIFAGSVPVYSGAPDIADFVPANVFINVADFASYDALVERLIEISENGELEEYRRRGTDYLNSPEFEPFTMEYFTRLVSDAILKIVR